MSYNNNYHRDRQYNNGGGSYRNDNRGGSNNYQGSNNSRGGGGGNYSSYNSHQASASSSHILPPSSNQKKTKIIHVDPSVVQKTKPSVNTSVQEIIQRRQLKYPISSVNISVGKSPVELPTGEFPNPLEHPSILIDTKTGIAIEDLSADTENDYIKKLLESCGPYASWKRLKDTNTNRWKTFGFCEYQSCASAIRAMKLLNGLEIEPGVFIKVKCGKKTQTFMDQYQQKKLELWSKRLKEKEEQLSNFDGGQELTPEQKQLLAQLEQQMGSANAPVEIRDKDKVELEKFETALDQISQVIIKDLVGERMNVENENRSRESISQQLAVSNTVQKIAESGVSNEETEATKNVIYDEIRRFRDNERLKEEETKQIEKRSREKIYKEKRLKQSKQLERERRRRLRWEKENEQDKRQREITIRNIEEFERRRERKYGGIDGTGQDYDTSDDEMDITEKKKIQIELQERSSNLPSQTANVSIGYSEEDEQEAWSGRKKKKLSAIEEIERSKQQSEYLDLENIYKSLPVSTADIFAFAIDWNIVDKYHLWQSLTKFVDEGVINLTGDSEESLSQFILGKIETHSPPQEVIDDLLEIFDDQTEQFVVGLWRKLLVEMIRKQREEEINNQEINE
ncbi:predicted protein [Naegleria gruberi]|uniref:Predicted protein n=1 Tax=Naegleria gruberi TaxID=5762 RepID=D2V2K4_NAEGR|nr:uncharacterized protein NAEGRDRAFT_63030 [Naegleria gruberi]EFC48912.1 predicted protein [Naegleria gruberi]|eukprot:XP_002681656.1 predicted protein [Naegleria gruberi strain NEG-M]